MTRWATGTVTTLLCANMLAGVSSAEPAPVPLTLTQVVLKGGANSILGIHGSTGLRFASKADSTFTLGTAFPVRLGLKPLVGFTETRRIGSNWSLNWTAGRGDFAGNYRVDRLAEITLARGANVTNLGYSLKAAVGPFISPRKRISAVRDVQRRRVATPGLSIEPVLTSVSPAEVTLTTRTLTQVVLRGGSNSILGTYTCARFGFGLATDTALNLGATFSERLGLEPEASGQTKRVRSNRSLSWTVTRADIGDDYRVNPLHRTTFMRGGNVGSLDYGLKAVIGSFSSPRRRVGAVRGFRSGSLATPAQSIEPARASVSPVEATAASLPITQVVLKGGSNSILGTYVSAGFGFALKADTTLTLGATFSERLGLEPLLGLAQTRRVGADWSLNWTASRGDFGGDYRVDRLPEIGFTRGGQVGTLGYGLEAGVGYFVVRPVGLSAARGVLSAQVATPALSIGPFLALSASTGYRQYIYSDGTLHSAWWRSVQLSVAPDAVLSTTFAYFKQDVSGTSPILFDAMGADHSLVGTATLKLGQAVTLQHSQTYSFISQTISARVYTISVVFPPSQSVSISWEAMPQKVSVSYSRSDFGAFSVGWEVPTQRLSLAFQR